MSTPPACGQCRHWKPTLLSDHEIRGPNQGYGKCNSIVITDDAANAPALLYASSSFDQFLGILEDGDASLLTRQDFGCTAFQPKASG